MKFFVGMLCGAIIAFCIEFALSAPAHYPAFVDHTYVQQVLHLGR